VVQLQRPPGPHRRRAPPPAGEQADALGREAEARRADVDPAGRGVSSGGGGGGGGGGSHGGSGGGGGGGGGVGRGPLRREEALQAEVAQGERQAAAAGEEAQGEAVRLLGGGEGEEGGDGPRDVCGGRRRRCAGVCGEWKGRRAGLRAASAKERERESPGACPVAGIGEEKAVSAMLRHAVSLEAPGGYDSRVDLAGPPGEESELEPALAEEVEERVRESDEAIRAPGPGVLEEPVQRISGVGAAPPVPPKASQNSACALQVRR
jgi:hypothetical protein